MPEKRNEAGKALGAAEKAGQARNSRSLRETIKRKLGSRNGFSMMELLMATLILALGGSIIVEGVPLAAEVCRKVVDYSNAQVLLSTTLTRLRDELGTAQEITPPDPGKTLKYICADGSESVIYIPAGGQGIYLREYNDMVASSEMKYDHLLVSNAASNKNLYMTYADFDDTTYNSSDGVITFENLEVKRDTDGTDETLVSIDEYKIRVLK